MKSSTDAVFLGRASLSVDMDFEALLSVLQTFLSDEHDILLKIALKTSNETLCCTLINDLSCDISSAHL